MKRIVILISGRGSNLQALLDARLPASIALVLSNRPDAGGLDIARRAGIPVQVLDHKVFASRGVFDAALECAIEAAAPDLVVLAGFMRVLGAGLVDRFARRLINIHPSLLPLFPGLHTHRRALDAGVKVHGCTVHFVNADVDHGPIIVQAAVPVLDGDDEASLAQRVLVQEHRVYPAAVRWFLQDRLRLDSGRVRLLGREASTGTDNALVVPENLH